MDALPPSLPNASQPQPVPAGQVGLAILLAELSNSLAQAIAKLPANTPLIALVTQILPSPVFADPSGANQQTGLLVQVSTPDGPAQIRLPPQASVTPGAKLDIVVTPAGPGPQPQARLLAINDRPVTPSMTGTPQSVSAPAPAPTLAAPTATTVQMAPKLPPSPGIPATLVTSSNPALPTGTTLLVRITELTPPQASEPVPEQNQGPQIAAEEPPPPPAAALVQTPDPGPTPASTPAAAVIEVPVPEPGTNSVDYTPEPVAGTPQPAPPPAALAPQTAAVVPPPTAPGAVVSVPAASPIPMPAPAQAPAQTPVSASDPVPIAATPTPHASPPPILTAPAPALPVQAPASNPTPTEISGQVLPNTDGGRPLVRTSIGLLALDTGPQALPPDTNVTLQIVGKPVPPPAFTPALPLPDDSPDRVLHKRLTQLVETTQNSPGGDGLAEAVREKIPAPGPRLAAQLLSAMASADQPQGLTRLLGDGLAAALTHAAPQAIEALSRHWEAASIPVQGPAEGDWRSLMLPFLIGGEITNLRLTVRKRKGKMAAAEREKGTRFLLDLDLSRLGPMQFDGLVKRQHKRFDLIIRTSTALSGEMRRDIDALFINGLLNFGLEGTVAFQPEGRFIVTPRLTGDANGMIFA